MTALPSPTETAAAEFRRRRIAWQQAGGRAPTEQADANLRLWLAIACAAGCGTSAQVAAGGSANTGADAGHLPELEWFRGDRIYPLGSRAPVPIFPHQIAPRDAWQAELLRARDTLLSRAWHPDATPFLRTRAAAVAELARVLRCPLHREPPQLEQAA